MEFDTEDQVLYALFLADFYNFFQSPPKFKGKALTSPKNYGSGQSPSKTTEKSLYAH